MLCTDAPVVRAGGTWSISYHASEAAPNHAGDTGTAQGSPPGKEEQAPMNIRVTVVPLESQI